MGKRHGFLPAVTRFDKEPEGCDRHLDSSYYKAARNANRESENNTR